jgi:hypothetical protein
MTNDSAKGAHQTLASYPGDVVYVSCRRCDRRSAHRRSSLMTAFGAGASLPDVLAGLANCPRASDASSPCGAHYSDLGPDGAR